MEGLTSLILRLPGWRHVGGPSIMYLAALHEWRFMLREWSMKVISKFFAGLLDSDTKSAHFCATVWARLPGKFLRVESMVRCIECADGCFPVDLPTRPGLRRLLLTPPWHWLVSEVLIFANPLWLWILTLNLQVWTNTWRACIFIWHVPRFKQLFF